VQLHSEHHEVVADLHQTSFLFSIPIDGPMSFCTSKVTVQWSLRFEFFTTPEGTDPARYVSVNCFVCWDCVLSFISLLLF
jgi:RAB6A-GEF complex partner protein 2